MKILPIWVGAMMLSVLALSQAATLDATFPYGEKPQGDVCLSQDAFATPETLLGSWAMVNAVESDLQNKLLPALFTSSNEVVYAVGTAAMGNLLGVPNCGGGCNALNGVCFALKFNNKPTKPNYMIFQSVNIGANNDSFDIYLPGGGAGAFPAYCGKFWGENSANWDAHIEDYQSCSDYFNYSFVNSAYKVEYNGKTYTAKDTLKNACEYATTTGFNRQNFSNVSVVPVTCPQSLTQITGLKLASETVVGTKNIIPLNALTEDDFNKNAVLVNETTQMQDCKTPSSGYCHNVSNAAPNYQASISAELTKPLLSGAPPSQTYCQQNPAVSGFCSWSNGESSGSTYCNQSEGTCKSCGSTPKWCSCDNGHLVGCN
ncbi:MAG: hypothetical protein WC785_02110 [Tatlockia sp.]